MKETPYSCCSASMSKWSEFIQNLTKHPSTNGIYMCDSFAFVCPGFEISMSEISPSTQTLDRGEWNIRGMFLFLKNTLEKVNSQISFRRNKQEI